MCNRVEQHMPFSLEPHMLFPSIRLLVIEPMSALEIKRWVKGRHKEPRRNRTLGCTNPLLGYGDEPIGPALGESLFVT